MKSRIVLSLCVIVLGLALAACNTPAPLPEAPTPIPTLIPATMPAPGAQNTPQPGVVLPKTAPAAAEGEATYAEKCAGCHGPDGSGVVEGSRDFTDVDYLRAAAPVDFFAVVTNGSGNMPAFKDELSDDERWNATYFLWSFAVPASQLSQGQTVYETAGCVACHGADGQGAIPQAAKSTADFIAQHPAQQYYQSVSAGKGIMPAHQDRLSAEDRWAAVEFVRSFGYQNASKSAAGSPQKGRRSSRRYAIADREKGADPGSGPRCASECIRLAPFNGSDQPVHPHIESIPIPARNDKQRCGRIDHLHTAPEILQVKIEVSSQVELVEHHRIDRGEHTGILVGLVMALGNAGDDDGTRPAPKSNSAGQTRLPTFSMKSRSTLSSGSWGKADRIIGASRWQLPPVLICTAGMPAARTCSVSILEARSPSITAGRTSTGSRFEVARIMLVLPAPGDAMILTARTPDLWKALRFSAATASFALRMRSRTGMSAIITHLNAIHAQFAAARHPQPGASAVRAGRGQRRGGPQLAVRNPGTSRSRGDAENPGSHFRPACPC